MPAAVTSSVQNEAPRSARWVRSASCTSPVRQVGGRFGEQRRRLGAEDERHPSVVAAQRSGADPGHVAAGHEGVEVGGPVPADPAREHVGLEDRRGNRGALEARDRVGERVEVASRPVRTLPRGEEPAERGRVDGLDLASEQGERPPPEPAEDVRIAPFAARAAGTELAEDDGVVRLQRREGLLHALHGRAETGGRPPTATNGPWVRAYRRTRPSRGRSVSLVNAPGRPIGSDTPSASRSRAASSIAASRSSPAIRMRIARPSARSCSWRARGSASSTRAAISSVGEIPERAEEVVQVVGRPGAAAVAQALELELHLVQRAGIEQLSQLLGAQQLAEQVTVERQGRRPPLRERGVALVHVDADPSEQQRLGEGRRVLRVDRDEAGAPRAEVGHHLAEGRDVEHVAQTLPGGFEQDREVGELRRLGQEVGGPLSLLPQRRSLAGAAPREQERPRRRLPEHAGEHRRLRHRRDHRLLDRVGVEQELLLRDAVDGLGEADDDAVVAPEHLGAGAEPLEHPGLDRHRPRGVHARAERGQDAHPPVADLVAEPLDDHGPVVGDGAGGLHLLLEVGHEVPRGELVQAHVAAEPLEGGVATGAAERAGEGAHGAAELDRAARLVAVPEGHPPLLAGRGGDDHPVTRDVLDAPGRGAEDDHVASPALVHHLLVELADARPVGQEDGVQAAVRDRAARGDRDQPGALASPNRSGPSIQTTRGGAPEPVARVAAGEHVEDRDEDVLRQLGERGTRRTVS